MFGLRLKHTWAHCIDLARKLLGPHGGRRLVALLLAAAGLTSGMLDDLDNRVGYLRFIALMRAAIAETGDRALALRFGADSDFRT